MVRFASTLLVALVIFTGVALAGDREVKGTVVAVDVKKKSLTVKVDTADKVYDVNADTKFLGPKGGASEAGLKDDRLVKGAEVKLLVAANNRTLREVHLPERKKEKGK